MMHGQKNIKLCFVIVSFQSVKGAVRAKLYPSCSDVTSGL